MTAPGEDDGRDSCFGLGMLLHSAKTAAIVAEVIIMHALLQLQLDAQYNNDEHCISISSVSLVVFVVVMVRFVDIF